MSRSRKSKTDRELSGLKGTRETWWANTVSDTVSDPGTEKFFHLVTFQIDCTSGTTSKIYIKSVDKIYSISVIS